MGTKDDDDDERAERREARDIERYGVDERSLTPIGLVVPGIGFVPAAVVNVIGYAWLGAWIVLFVTGNTGAALAVMFPWIAASGAWQKRRQQLRRERKRQIQQHIDRRAAVESGTAPAALTAGPGPAGDQGAAGGSATTSAGSAGSPTGPTSPTSPTSPVSPAERALTRTLRRVETSERFERRDAVLVGELADVLFPLLAKVAEPGADPVVRRDVETIATEHLPASVEAFLALPAEHARTGRNTAGRTPLEELRRQLDLLLTGCEQLQEAVLRADVSRQQAQSRFLEEKFRPSGLDL